MSSERILTVETLSSVYSKKKIKIDFILLIIVLLLATISLISINSAENLLGSRADNYTIKQLIWYIIGFIAIIILSFIKNENILKYTKYLYLAGVLSLIILLIFGKPINNAKCWFEIPHIGVFQPSEFMKIILILFLSYFIDDFHDKYPIPSIKEELFFLLKVAIIVGIPSILTFLQPDTGVVLIYLLITFIMLFISGIRYRWFATILLTLAIGIGSVLAIYFINTDLFIKIFGTSFFLRVDRLLDWSSKSGYQLENGMTAIGSAGIFGFGVNKTPIYFPEPQTDFIFAVYASNFGYIGSIILLALLLCLDLKLINIAMKATNNINKYIISGCVAMLIYQQVQNIGMTFGLLPITGITLPFISYGGSSLLSYMIMLGIIFNISSEEKRNYLN